ncbi:hypothetical protein BK816_01265 [Boudabousia tangfeifanii]|uniref:Major facilitator superfamily (MFS) profile domain-containing protein n=1 Tax=Boudabousia tangfeifanii TaxID=1912795 RepID=A0A1D9MII6_9ACTO|nr:MFS transporter [Boudabousia tangfeifanii]AOZ72092.1 hypothetical protein BK816_01265 [Boudabousia tangfeifanii]
MSERTDRLDNLPFGRPHKKLLVGSGIGWALDAMDVGLISYVMAALAKEWGLTHEQTGWLGSSGFLGMMLGASLGGLLADRIGRRNVFALTLLVYGLATGAAAFSTGLVMLLILRFLVGVGLGAELPVASTLVSEFAPQRIRGRMLVALESFWAVGWIGAALLGYFIVPKTFGAWAGWRVCLLVGIVPAAYAWVVRRHLPESVRFLESQGRFAEAESVVAEFEAGVGVTSPVPSASVAVDPTPLASSASVETATGKVIGVGSESANSTMENAENTMSEIAGKRPNYQTLEFKPSLKHLFEKRYLSRTIALWVVWFCINLAYYGAFIWLPTLLTMQGFTLVRSFEFTLIMTLAQLPGYAMAAWLIEVIGRRWTLAIFLLGSALSAGLFGTQTGVVGIIVFGCAMSFFNLGAWGALYAIGPEIYPTLLRGTGTGAAAAVGRLAAILAPLAVPKLLAAGGASLVFLVFGSAFAIAALAAWRLPEHTAQPMAGE